MLGFGVPIIGECDLADCTVNAPVEGTVGLTGNLKGNRALFQLRGTKAQLITDPDGSGQTYDTLTISGIKIHLQLIYQVPLQCIQIHLQSQMGAFIK